MKIAVEGCAHGELEKIYECIETIQEREAINIDLLICCGDFQSVRNNEDLRAMAVPDKFKHMCSFHKYYSGELRAPILTIFIGGNHEASNYLQELPYGGWVAPNIYYLGRAGVINFGNLRIGGLSGIFKGRDYLQGLWESVPYDQNALRSVYHIRSLDVFRLTQMKDKVHVMLSHDWPKGITNYGDVQNLLKWKPFLREDIESNQLGSDPAMKLLNTLKPDYWFAAHLHCQFAALVTHDEPNTETKFLALDKCLPKRRHLQILDLPLEYDGDKCLKHDIEWLAILKNTNHLLTVKNIDCHMPGPGSSDRYNFSPTEEEKANVAKIIGNLAITEASFVRTAPVYNINAPKITPREAILNPQTVGLCEKLGIDDPVQVIMARTGRSMKPPCDDSQVEIVNSANSPDGNANPKPSPIVNTPIKISKLSLPAPVTPSGMDNGMLSPKAFTPENSTISESTDSFYVCTTPNSAPKKAFKRRNISIYNSPDVDDSVSTDTSSLLDDSPRSSKLPLNF